MSRGSCSKCGKTYAVVGTRTDAEFRTNYLGCRACGERASQPEIVPLASAPRQNGPGRPAK